MRAAAPLTVVVLLAARPVSAEVSITAVGDHVNLRAVAAPLAEVLDQLGRRTGMKVIYEGGQPRQPITLTVEDRTTAQAVYAVMEGQGLNFGLRMDASGTRVDHLLVLGLAPLGTGSTASSSAAAAARPAPMQVLPSVIEEEREEPPEIDQPDPEPPPGLVQPPGPPTRRPGGPMSRGPVQQAPPTAFPQTDSLSGGSPFAPRAEPFPQPQPQPQSKEPN